MRAFFPGEEVRIALFFVYEGDEETESVEAVYARQGSDEIDLLGYARREASGRKSPTVVRRPVTRHVLRQYRSRGNSRRVSLRSLSARDRCDDDWDFAALSRLGLTVHVNRAPLRLVTTSGFL